MKKPCKDYLPDYLKENDFFVLITDLLDWLFDEELSIENLSPSEKYNLDVTDEDGLKEIMAELGFDYISDVVNLTKEELKTLVQHTFLLHYLKGTRTGLELALKLLGIEHTVEEWFEMDPPGDPYTFNLVIDMPLNQVPEQVLDKLRTFFRSYVFPKWIMFLTWYGDIAQVSGAFGGFSKTEVSAEFTSYIPVPSGWLGTSVTSIPVTFEATL